MSEGDQQQEDSEAELADELAKFDHAAHIARREAYAIEISASLSLKWPSPINVELIAEKAVEIAEAVMQANKLAP